MMLMKLVGGMNAREFSNTVVSLTDRGTLGETIESQGIPVHSLGMRRGRPSFSTVPRLRALLKTIKPSIVQSWLYHADFLSTVTVRLCGTPPLVWNVRCSDMDLTQYSPLTGWIRRMLARLSPMPVAVVVNSEAGRSYHEQLGYHPRRWEIIPNGFDIERYRPNPSLRAKLRMQWDVPDDTVVIALVARVDPMKDHATFLDAARQVASVTRHVLFMLIGKDTEALASEVATRKLNGMVRLLGYQSDVASLLPGADVLCLSSAFGEGFPNILGEAMSCGIPCVSTDVGDTRQIVGDTGLIVPPSNPSALAEALMELIGRGASAREQLGRAARERIETVYALPKIIRRYCDLYSELAQVPVPYRARG